MIEWKENKLADLCIKITDGSHYSPPTVEFGYPMASVKDMKDNRIDIDSCRRISEESFHQLVKNDCKPLLNDVLIAKDGSFLKHVFDITQEEEIVLLSSIAIIRPNLEKINPKFLKYVFKNPLFKENIEGNFVTGAVIPRIVLKDFKEIKINVPSLPEQKAIASILSSLDDKIDLLHWQNKTLEAMAETLFRKWFVEEADESWEEKELEEVCLRIASGGTPSTKVAEFYNGNINWYSTKELNDNFLFDSSSKITSQGLENSSAKLFPENTIVIAIYAAPTVGRLGILGKEASFNQAACGFIVDENKICYEYLYLYLLLSREKLHDMACGSAQQNLNVSIMKSFPIIVPAYERMKKFRIVVRPIFSKIKANTIQIQNLEKLRDTLLPKLMSGEVKIIY